MADLSKNMNLTFQPLKIYIHHQNACDSQSWQGHELWGTVAYKVTWLFDHLVLINYVTQQTLLETS